MTEDDLEDLLSEPTAELINAFRRIKGDILVLGVSGKMGPSLARLALNATTAAGTDRRIIGVARFGEAAVREALDADGITTVGCDLLNHNALDALPDAANVIFMAGRKFGTTGDQPATWATNAYLPGLVAERFKQARIVVFSTGNVYPLVSIQGDGPTESDPVGPIGEYAQAALARERIFEFFSRRNDTRMAILRLNYAVEPRYGVLRDVADQVFAGRPVDLSMGYANVIWQRDASAIALRMLEHCASPPLVLNVTGKPALSIRSVAQAFGRQFDREPILLGVERETALLSDAARCETLFGAPPVHVESMVEHIAAWVKAGGRSFNRPTHFTQRDGAF
jgi:nucleoside-diphosphate-sugar epimerase